MMFPETHPDDTFAQLADQRMRDVGSERRHRSDDENPGGKDVSAWLERQDTEPVADASANSQHDSSENTNAHEAPPDDVLYHLSAWGPHPTPGGK